MTAPRDGGPVSLERKPLVIRSVVPQLETYGEYKRYLRLDFYYSCAYCTMNEAEAKAIRFVIDHYEPQQGNEEKIAEYANLMYACDECNARKIDTTPPPKARAAGHRYFRPDVDLHEDHFRLGQIRNGIEIEAISNIGEFTLHGVDLNRQSLRRLRGLRAELAECDAFLVHGIAGLKSFPIDRLPVHIKGKAARAITNAVEVVDAVGEQLDDILREYARSELVDPEEGPEYEERQRNRKKAMRASKTLFPGVWLGRHLTVEQSAARSTPVTRGNS